jgi:(p)ppGpp synthase/HD superfamily hydrolase
VYASDAHRKQRRKGSNVPYVGHLLGVASIVIDNGGNEDEVIAALLHDVAEDQGGVPRLDDVRAKFGARVAAIVEACSDSLTEDPEVKDPWLERKRAYLRHLAEGTDASVFLVSAADKLHNLRAMLADYAIVGEKLWDRFNSEAGKVRIIQYYRSLLATYKNVRDEHVTRVARALERTLAEFEAACGASALTGLADGKGLL